MIRWRSALAAASAWSVKRLAAAEQADPSLAYGLTVKVKWPWVLCVSTDVACQMTV
jgi:hypothetical protein